MNLFDKFMVVYCIIGVPCTLYCVWRARKAYAEFLGSIDFAESSEEKEQ